MLHLLLSFHCSCMLHLLLFSLLLYQLVHMSAHSFTKSFEIVATFQA